MMDSVEFTNIEFNKKRNPLMSPYRALVFILFVCFSFLQVSAQHSSLMLGASKHRIYDETNINSKLANQFIGKSSTIKSGSIERVNAELQSLGDSIYISTNGKNMVVLVNEDEYAEWQLGFANNRQSIFESLYKKMNDDFDFIFVVTNDDDLVSGNSTYGMNMQVSNDVEGIGLSKYNNTTHNKLGEKVKSVIWLPARRLVKTGPSLHELAHNWGAYAFKTNAFERDGDNMNEIDYAGHWGVSSVGGQLGGFDEFKSNVDGKSNKYQGLILGTPGFGQNANWGNSVPYSNLELYLMGLIPPEEVEPVSVFHKLKADSPWDFFQLGEFYSDSVVTYDINALEAENGIRIPNSQNSQKSFKAMFILVAKEMPSSEELNEIADDAAWFGFNGNDENSMYNFYEATGGRASIEVDNYWESVKITPSYSLKFIVSDGTSAVKGAQINVQDIGSMATDSLGIAVFDSLSYKKDVEYTVTADDLRDFKGTIAVIDENITENISLSAVGYNLSFTINDGSHPISGATIHFEGTNYMSNAEGQVSMEDISNGTYPYSVSKIGYDTISTNIKVSGADLNEIVHMVQNPYPLTLADVEFDASTGTITAYKSSYSDIIIPSVFTVNGVEVAVKELGHEAFHSNNLTSVTIAHGVEVIGNYAFMDNKLTTVNLPASIIRIRGTAFSNNRISTVNGQPSNGLFYYRNDDGTVDSSKIVSYGGVSKVIDFIPNTVTHISNYAFGYNLLTSVTIPMGVKSIWTGAFHHNSLTSLTLPNSVIEIGGSAFANNLLTNVTIPNSVTDIRGAAFNANSITVVNGDQSNGLIYARKDDGSEDYTTVVSYGGVSNVIDFIPNNVTTIVDHAFLHSHFIIDLVLPSSVTFIGRGAFENIFIPTLNIPKSIRFIGERAFYYNPELTSITFEENSNIQEIGKDAFNFSLVSSIVLPSNAMGSVTYVSDNNISYKPGDQIRDFSPGYTTHLATSAKEDKLKKDVFTVYPVPAKNEITIIGGDVRLEIINSTGIVVMNLKINSTRQRVDISHLPNGLYFVKSNKHVRRFTVVK